MAQSFIGEIRIFAGNYAPRNWAFCDGQVVSTSQFDALFSLLGTIYGGDGRTSFAFPDMRGRIPTHFGTGPTLTEHLIGSKFGTETVTLTLNEIPAHEHPMMVSKDSGFTNDPTGQVPGTTPAEFYTVPTDQSKVTSLMPNTVGSSGGNQPHSNLMPTLCINFILSLQGTYPSRN